MPNKEGGLGLRDLFSWNTVVNLKLIWMLFSKGDSLWVTWVRSHWLKKHVFWTAPATSCSSWVWRSLLSLRPLAQRLIACKLGDGKQASFWHDRWHNQGPLMEVIGGNGPQRLGIPTAVTVAKASVGDIWRTTPTRTICPKIAALRTALTGVTLPRPDAGEDRFLWGEDQNRLQHFSTRRT